MGSSRFVASYLRTDNPFLWVHLAIAAICLLLMAAIVAASRRADKELDRAGELTEAEVRSFSFPTISLLGYLETCGAAFVLVGLIGTMAGFVEALPKLQQADYDFGGFAVALSTSAFGICWSVALMFAVGLLKAITVDPLTKRLYGEVKAQRLAEILAGTVQKFGESVSQELKDGTSKFATASIDLAHAAGTLGAVTRTTAESFGTGMQRTLESADKLNSIVEQLSALPSRIATELESSFETIGKAAHQQSLRFQEDQEKRARMVGARLGTALTNALSKLDHLPSQMEGAVSAQSRIYGEAFDSLSKAAVVQLTAHLEELRRQERQAVSKELVEHQRAVDQMIKAATAGLRGALGELVGSTTALSRTIAEAAESSNRRLADTLSKSISSAPSSSLPNATAARQLTPSSAEPGSFLDVRPNPTTRWQDVSVRSVRVATEGNSPVGRLPPFHEQELAVEQPAMPSVQPDLSRMSVSDRAGSLVLQSDTAVRETPPEVAHDGGVHLKEADVPRSPEHVQRLPLLREDSILSRLWRLRLSWGRNSERS